MSTATRDAVSRKVIETLASFGPAIEDVSPERTLEELDIDSLDIDSLDIAELAQVVEDEYGVEISGDDAAGVTTVGDTIGLVLAKLP
jgi:acyl carrier protein